MKAFIYDKYGPPQTLCMTEADKPLSRAPPRGCRPGEGGRGNGMRNFPSAA
jgi:hypothetical protein